VGIAQITSALLNPDLPSRTTIARANTMVAKAMGGRIQIAKASITPITAQFRPLDLMDASRYTATIMMKAVNGSEKK